ncbi:hypothetical protein HMP0721_0901 [Pseudoramibacter alactolyticus ATCC 23263]|uniref:Uncharacterized protein n=1 Tax=Pseudoramibacter alactolyticus ATCC 23263 TaxID=887929 RepID=E6MFL8_9FIRM|nr:hypothetical protein HMP0721_0901 [Pseudoramibacter alactolyticus ATCC 23263]
MPRNNVELDVKIRCIEKEVAQLKLSEEIHIAPADVNRLIKKAITWSIKPSSV